MGKKKRVETVKDYKMLLDAYFNFVGHSALFPQKIVDTMIRKGIELRQTALVIPIIENHNFLFYYPAPDVLTLLMVFKLINFPFNFNGFFNFFRTTS